jgi:hypothetical protein
VRERHFTAFSAGYRADDEKTRARKKKLQKSFKSKHRFQAMDAAQKSKADAWKSFVSGKGACAPGCNARGMHACGAPFLKAATRTCRVEEAET